MELSEYALEPLRKDDEFILYRGERPTQEQASRSSILVLAPASPRPAPASLEQLTHEYSLRSELDSRWAVRPIEISHASGHLMLVLEDPGGEPLDRLIQGPMEIGQFLRVGIGLASALGRLHERALIHKNVKPANVLVDSALQRVWLTGFGIASRIPRERQAPLPPETIAGTLAYMAPEQTGCMNRSIDSRTDLYSLGVVLYEMLTGTLPFAASNPMEWVHCHVATQPVSPRALGANTPFSVAAIIVKLLAKTAEERYQTAGGVQRDLRRCLDQWDALRRIDEFPLGQHDTPEQLLIPETLYGRAQEVEALLASFDRVVAGGRAELVLVSGNAGVGKSSIVNELHKALVPTRGLFASGKFDQYKRDIPYASLGQAFQSLVRPLLSKTEAELSTWRATLSEALGPNGMLVVDLVPDLRLVIGEPPAIPDLSSQDAKARSRLVFRRFLGVFARAEHPLALFLDDLQWLDSATHEFLEDLLVQPDVRHVLVIGAYRDNEVDRMHPLMRTLSAIRHAGAPVQEISLAPLGRDDLAQLTADALHCDCQYASPLALLVHEKTAGNPFFVIHFIRSLVEERLIKFDHGDGRWLWDVNRIQAKGYTDNVVDLMISTINRLPSPTQKALRELACIGNIANTTTLALVHGTSEDELHAHLWDACHLELIGRSTESYRFVHDRVREAAYSLIPDDLRPTAHLRTARLLSEYIPPEKREEDVFEIVNQFNRALELITSRDERDQVAELNLIAGRRAKASTAYSSSLTYLGVGAALLADHGWERRRELTFALELARAECEYLTGQLGPAEQRLSALAERTANLGERAAVASLFVDLYVTLGQPDRASAASLDYLRYLGIEWSVHPTDEDVKREYDRIWSQVGTRTIEELIDLPLMIDPISLGTLDVLTKAILPAWFTDTNLGCLVTCRAANLSLERGNSDSSCTAYEYLGIVAGPCFGNYKAGEQFGRLGYELVEKRGLRRFQSRTYMLFGNVIMPWTTHIRAGRDLVRRAFDVAKEVGDLTFAAFSCKHLNTNLLAVGDPLAEVQREAENGLEFAKNARFGFAIDTIRTQLALIRTLRGLTRTFGCFDDDEFEEAGFERHLASSPALVLAECWYWTRKVQARFLAGDNAGAVDAALRAHRLVWTSPSWFETAECHFYGALAHAACCGSTSTGEHQHHLAALTAHYRQLAVWATNCPENFENRAALAGAEIARVEGRTLDAEALYEQAIRSAHANGFVHNEALANELAGRFYAARGFPKVAQTYLREARYFYGRWGAQAKVRQLDELYPDLITEHVSTSPASTIRTPVEHLELATVIRVSQAVSGEIVLENLIDVLMRTAIEHAGAARGLLLLPRGDALHIVAEGTTVGGTIVVRLTDAPAAADSFPESIAHYVTRTQETVVVNDTSAQNPFAADPYIRVHRTRSILCLPLIRQRRLIGILHLENNLAAHAFTSTRLAVLTLLASQAAISLENTRLFADRKQTEEELRRSEADLHEAQRLSHTGSWKLDLRSSRVSVSPEVFRIFGVQSDEETASPDFWFNRIHHEDRQRVREHFERCVARNVEYEADYRIVLPDGTIKYQHVIGHPTVDECGAPREFLGTAMDVTEQVHARLALENAFEEITRLRDRLQDENLALKEEIAQVSMFEEVVGASAALKAVVSRVTKVAPTDSTVLLTGETGTGKELIARAIHKRSQRSSHAFVCVNCAAIPVSLIASELFGHEKGAFTGASGRRMGRFELAKDGTIFLDEVGELPAETQVALLRVLQEREFERVGGNQRIRSNARVVAATNRDLDAAIAAGTFRSDLFYRLNVFPIEAPPLRERKEDIPLLVEYFIARFARKAGKTIRGISKNTLDLLMSYPWPGNIRELQNVVERSVIVCEAETFSVDESWLSRQAHRSQPTPHPDLAQLAVHEKEIIEAALRESGGRVAGPSGAATKLGIPGSTLESKIKSLRINKNRFKA